MSVENELRDIASLLRKQNKLLESIQSSIDNVERAVWDSAPE